jgi:hypothetical protein
MINQLTQAGTHIDQVRELMFGPQLREYNQRLQQLESTIVQLVEGPRSILTRSGRALPASCKRRCHPWTRKFERWI